MKNLLIFVLLFFLPLNSNSKKHTIESNDYNNKIIVYQINSTWNERNSIKNLKKLRDCKYVYGYLEDQPTHFKKGIKSVPAIFITINGKVVYRYQAGLSMRATIGYEEIQEIVNKHK
jgi:hypothetical protein